MPFRPGCAARFTEISERAKISERLRLQPGPFVCSVYLTISKTSLVIEDAAVWSDFSAMVDARRIRERKAALLPAAYPV